MKLTLRTLLAYIDNLLPPHDAEEFEALLNENAAANNLCKRIQSVMTRPELGAPDVLDKGLHLDPNVTAEYLDNVLSSEESPEYERLCISSDRQLSEVSACHQILTVVQIEPAEVDPAWREKIYTAPERVTEEESVDLDGGLDAPAPASSGFMASLSGILSGASGILGGGQSLKLNLDRKKSSAPIEKSEPIPVPPQEPAPQYSTPSSPSIPVPPVAPPADNQPNIANPQAALEQYAQMITPEMETQEKPRNNPLTWILSLGAMAALIILFVVLFLGPKNKGKTEVANNDNTAVSEEASAENSADKAKDAKPQTESAQNSNDEAQNAPSNTEEDNTLPSDSSNNDNQLTDLPTLEADESPSPITEDNPSDANNDDSLSELDETVDENETDQSPDSDDVAPVDSTEPEDNLTPDKAPADVTNESEPVEEEDATNDSSLELFEDAPQQMVEVGRFVKRKGVEPQLLAYKAKGAGETWQRLSENAAVRSGDSLLAFPDYRPDVSLGASVRIRLVGPARVSISPKSTPDEIHLTLEYGRMILVASKDFSQKIVVKCAALPTELEINQPSVKVAFEADVLKPEDNPASTPARFYGTISLSLGKANLIFKGAQSPVVSPTFIDCQSGALNPQGMEADWIKTETPPSTDLEKRISGDKPIGVTLSEIVDSKTTSKELRQTALISLSMVGQYSTLVEDFNKEDRYAVWMDEFIVLQSAIFKSQANAKSALDELRKRYDDKGDRIYDILWKYHSDLSDKDMSDLIADLRNETLGVRVAAFCLLKSRGVNLGAYKPTDLKKSEAPLKSLENKYKNSLEL
ncbi:MAG: hypothetical protein IKX40_14260 [Thermoguttaceae bacterium]|nr:hypothetical protein [Thermoguttaceae bacterium]